jgi:hypothetical protein
VVDVRLLLVRLLSGTLVSLNLLWHDLQLLLLSSLLCLLPLLVLLLLLFLLHLQLHLIQMPGVDLEI